MRREEMPPKSEPYLVYWKKDGKRSKGKIVCSLTDASDLAEEKGRNGCISFFKKIPPKEDKQKKQEIRNTSHPP